MLDPIEFIHALDSHGISFYAGVPCSFLKEPMRLLADRPGYVGAVIETDALALCAGAWLAGRKTAVFCQNSGLGNMISPLSSLNAPFAIPTLLVIGWRGKPGKRDEPQHSVMGETTQQMLAAMNVVSFELPTCPDTANQTLGEAMAVIDNTGKSAALLVGPDTFETLQPTMKAAEINACKTKQHTAVSDLKTGNDLPTRYAVLEALVENVPTEAAVIATTGKCGRELYSIADKDQHFYMVGSMGSASAIGLGVAVNTDQPVVVVDGDGAALMRLGTMATAGTLQPANYIHLLLDNEAHDSTGGQPTGSDTVDFCAVAAACGYETATSCDDTGTIVAALQNCLRTPGPHLLHCRIKPGSIEKLARPAVAPSSVAKRFKAFLKSAEPD